MGSSNSWHRQHSTACLSFKHTTLASEVRSNVLLLIPMFKTCRISTSRVKLTGSHLRSAWMPIHSTNIYQACSNGKNLLQLDKSTAQEQGLPHYPLPPIPHSPLLTVHALVDWRQTKPPGAQVTQVESRRCSRGERAGPTLKGNGIQGNKRNHEAGGVRGEGHVAEEARRDSQW